MKKLISFALVLSLALCLSGCVATYLLSRYSESAEKDGFNIAFNSTARRCYVSYYTCREYAESYEITIPDEYDGMPIKQIGGYFGTGFPDPFSISLAELYMNAPEESEYFGTFHEDSINDIDIPDEYTVVNVVFKLNIGQNIEVIEYVDMDRYYPHINEDSSITFYHPVVEIACSEENKHFYSKDGKLYNKSNNELITDFAYND